MIRQLVAAYNFRKTGMTEEQAINSLAQVARWAQSQVDTEGESMQTHAHLYDQNLVAILENPETASLRDWDGMTFDELSGIHQMVKHLRHVGGKMSEAYRESRQAELDDLASSMEKNAKRGVAALRKTNLRNKLREAAQGYGASVILHADSILRRLDGFKDGKMYQAIKRPIDDAMSKLTVAERTSDEEMQSIYDGHYTKAEMRSMNREVMVGDVPMSKWKAISLALNWGNASSKEAILESTIDGTQPYTEDFVAQTLDMLDENDWEFVREVWDYTAQFKQDLFALEKKLTGVAPPAVEPVDVSTKFGVIKGGYYPLSYDPKASLKVNESDINTEMRNMRSGVIAHAHTKDGMVKARKGSGKRPVNLDMMVWRDAAAATGNNELLHSLDTWIKDVAAGEVVAADVTSLIMRNIRAGFSMSAIGWNFGTMLVQPLGLLQSMPVIGYGNVMKGLGAVLSDPFGKESAFKRVQALSPFMNERGRTFNKDIKDTIHAMHGKPNNPGFLPDFVRDYAFSGIVFTQRFVDTATWLGAYEAAKAETDNEADLIHAADRAVARSQASGVWTDRTPIERGTVSARTRQAEYVRIWTALGSYFFAKANVANELFGKTNFRDPKDVVKFSMDMMLLFAVEAVLVGLLRNTWPDEDEEDKTVAGYIAGETLSSVFSSYPLLREAASEIAGFRGGSAASGFYKAIGDAWKQAEQGELDMPLAKAINKVGGIALKYPAGAINRFVDSWVKSSQGEDVDPIDFLMWRKKD
jgi:hypothetical protein